MDGINAYIIPVKNTKTGTNYFGSIVYGGKYGISGNCMIHRRNDFFMYRIDSTIHLKQSVQPVRRNLPTQKNRMRRPYRFISFQRHGHDLCCVGDMISSFHQLIVKRTVHKRIDLEDRRSAPFLVYFFAVIDLVCQINCRRTNLFDTVCSVGVKTGITKNPSIIDLNLMRRPGVEGKIFDCFDFHFHLRFLISELLLLNSNII